MSQKLMLYEDGQSSLTHTSIGERSVLTCVRYDSEGRNASFTAFSNSTVTRTDNSVLNPADYKTIDAAKTDGLGMNDRPDFFNTQATVAFIKQETFNYPACANPDGCNKKVMDNGDGWLCEKCDRKWPEPIYRYVHDLAL